MTDSLGIAISGTMCMWRRDRTILRSRCQVLVCNMQLCSTPPSPVYLLVPWRSTSLLSRWTSHKRDLMHWDLHWLLQQQVPGWYYLHFSCKPSLAVRCSIMESWFNKRVPQPQNMKGIRLSILEVKLPRFKANSEAGLVKCTFICL